MKGCLENIFALLAIKQRYSDSLLIRIFIYEIEWSSYKFDLENKFLNVYTI